MIVLTVEIQDTPSIQCHKRVEFVRNLDFLSHVVLKFGYMETPDVPETLGLAFRDGKFGFGYPTSELFYILGRETIVQARHTNMLQDLITGVFSFMQRNSVRSAAYFAVPAGLVVQIGIEIEM